MKEINLGFEDSCNVTRLAYNIKYKAGCLMMHRGIESFGKDYDSFLDVICEASGKAFVFGITERQRNYYFIKAKALFSRLPEEVKSCYIEAAKECSDMGKNLIEACI